MNSFPNMHSANILELVSIKMNSAYLNTFLVILNHFFFVS
jgi:hypothetical protein